MRLVVRGVEVAAADHTPAAAWETSLQRTSGKVELPLAASDAPMGGPKTSPTVFECLRGWSSADTCRRALAWLQHWAFACQLLFGGRSRAARQPMTRLQRLVFCIMRQGRFAEHASRLLRLHASHSQLVRAPGPEQRIYETGRSRAARGGVRALAWSTGHSRAGCFSVVIPVQLGGR